MRTPEEFDEIRPYDPEELPGVFEELIADKEFQQIVGKVLPDMPYEEACRILRSCKTSYEVQKTLFYPLLINLRNKLSDGFTLGYETLKDKTSPHTYITNHRDIVIDSAFLSIAMIENGFGNTVEIAIGDNLLIRPWIKKLVRVNKSFIVQRGISMREILRSSARMSRYMHYAINTKHENIWIAQREGRAKDSDDRTQDAILKMMAMGGEGSVIDRLKDLHIVPTTLSYEYDPCDYLKAQEFQQKRDIEGFKKSPADDLLNMQTGIFGYKGRIHFQMGDCLDEWLGSLPADLPKTEVFTVIANHIDKEIHRRYRLYPGNYVAADKLTGQKDYAAFYTPEDEARFEKYLEGQLAKVTLQHPDHDFLRNRLLIMYANPVFNKFRADNEH